jgi:superfamily II DNA or RNA helicase
MTYKRPTSFSQNMLFWNCPRTWYMKYVQKIPGIEDLVYAHRGSVVHNCLEEFYPEKTKTVQEIKELFESEWDKYNLSTSKLKKQKDASWLMVLNAMEFDLPSTSTELKIFYPDVVAYIDLLDTNEGVITDWKTSTRSHHNEKEYMMQVKFYAWLYYRKFGVLPTLTNVKYLKYTGTKSELGCVPTMEDVEAAEKWHFETRRRMNYYIEYPDKLPAFNQDYFFCPYKHLWDLESKPKDNILTFILQINGNYIYLKGDLNTKLNEHISKKFSYELKDAFFIKKNRPGADPTIRFWHMIQHRLPIGFQKQLMKTLQDYAAFRNKTLNLQIQDSRYFDTTEVDMPDKLLSGKELRPYQQDAVDTFIARNKIGILELTTGAGKTLIATEIIRRLAVKTLFVVDKKELLYQTKETLEENLGIPIGIIGDGEKNIQNVTVATIQTLNKNIDEFKEYLEEVRLSIFDETHKIAAKSYYQLAYHLKGTEYRLGISATAFRDDGNDMMITASVGEVVYSLKGQELIEKGYLMRPDIYFIKDYMTTAQNKEYEAKSKEGLINETDKYAPLYDAVIVKNKHRNEKISDVCKLHSDKQILILVKHVEHGETLEGMIEGAKYIYGETSKKKRRDALDDFKAGKLKVLISTISIFAEGVDIPSLDIVINAAANKGDIKTIQVLGRVLRKNEGKDKARYYDFIDMNRFFKSASFSRRSAFIEEGHNVSIIEELK